MSFKRGSRNRTGMGAAAGPGTVMTTTNYGEAGYASPPDAVTGPSSRGVSGGGGGSMPVSDHRGGVDAVRGSPALTPDIIRARYAPAARLNPSLYIGEEVAGAWPAGGDDQADDGLGWRQFEVDRPTILVPVEPVLAPILYTPQVPAREDSRALRAAGSGVVVLYAPGIWFVKVDGANHRIGMIVVPAEDPTVASLWATRPGALSVSPTGNNVSKFTVAAGGTAGLLAANPNRRQAVISIGSEGETILGHLKFGSTGPSSSADSHVFMNACSSYTIGGDGCHKGGVRFANGLTSSAAATVYVVEFE